MKKIVNLIPVKTNINFIGLRKIGIILSIVLLLTSLTSLITKGLNFGIDFAGGIAIEAKLKNDATVSSIREKLSEINPVIQSIGKNSKLVSIKIAEKEIAGSQNETIAKIKDLLGENIEYRNVESVGPKVGDRLINDGILALTLALLAICVYIWIRFELPFALGALFSLLHDIVITIGIFALTGFEFELATVAAILTLAGYSINDTVVSYDKIRENLKKYRKMDIKELLNLSINETFSRTILTSITTFLAVLSIYIFGGITLQSFAFAMLFGVIIGTYSSIFIAIPILLLFDIREHTH
jgi:preprotein translocase SecF subunit